MAILRISHHRSSTPRQCLECMALIGMGADYRRIWVRNRQGSKVHELCLDCAAFWDLYAEAFPNTEHPPMGELRRCLRGA